MNWLLRHQCLKEVSLPTGCKLQFTLVWFSLNIITSLAVRCTDCYYAVASKMAKTGKAQKNTKAIFNSMQTAGKLTGQGVVLLYCWLRKSSKGNNCLYFDILEAKSTKIVIAQEYLSWLRV